MADQYKAYIADISEFKPDPKNHNRHKLKGHKMVTNSMQNRGYARPGFSANDGTVLGGNLSTMEIAPSLGIGGGKVLVVETDGDLPIIHKRRDISPDSLEARQLSYEDNFTSHFSFELDPEIVSADMSLGFDFEAIDVSLSDLSLMLEGAAGSLLGGNGNPPQDPGPQIDRAEELQKKWQVQPGDLWQIDRHFVICGDCREAAIWERLLKAAGIRKVNGVFTSPPYAEQRKQQYGGVPTVEYVQWWEAVQGNVRGNLAGDGSFFVNIKPHCEEKQRNLYVFDLVCSMVRNWGWRYVDEFCWTHVGYPGDFGDRFKNQFEPIYHFSISNSVKVRHSNVLIPPSEATLSRIATARRSGETREGRKYSQTGTGFNIDFSTMQQAENGVRAGNVIWADQDKGHSGVDHAAPFPLPLPTFFINAFSDKGDVWIDPFCGSGTTIVSCEREGRIGLGCEISPTSCAVILQRFEDLGLAPIRL